MELRRIQGLPPYVFAQIDQLKLRARRAGIDVIDLGFGNPDIASPDVAVEKLAEAVRNPRNHRYSASRGIPKLRQAIADLYLRVRSATRPRKRGRDDDRRQGGALTPHVGRGRPGDTALVPSPVLPDPSLRAVVRRGRRPHGPPRGSWQRRGGRGRSLLCQPRRGLGVGLAQTPGGDLVVPPQPDDGVHRPRH